MIFCFKTFFLVDFVGIIGEKMQKQGLYLNLLGYFGREETCSTDLLDG